MKNDSQIKLELLPETDVPQTVSLIRLAMNPDEAAWAEKTFGAHFACKEHGIDDGRNYFICRDGEQISGLVGLHNYNWGPPENVWLAWFAVHPDCQRKGLGSALIDSIEKRATEMGYTALFIETYEHNDFAKARAFYQAKGFTQSGRIDSYLPDGSAMIVYRKGLPVI